MYVIRWWMSAMCTLHDFSVLKSSLFIRALLLDRILVTEKTTRTPRVHLVLYIESLWMFRQTFRTSLSSVEIPLERGSSRSAEPINLKIGLEIGHWVNEWVFMPCLKGVVSRKSLCKLQIYEIYDYLQINLCARFWLTYLPDFAENWYTCTLHNDACLKYFFFQNYYR